MKQDDKLIRALDLVDDDLIEKAAPGRYRKKAPKKQWLRYVVAACLALCLLSGVVATWIGNSGDPSVIAPGPSLSIDGDYSAIAGKLQLLQSEDVTEFNRLFPPLTTSIPGDPFEPPLVDREELEGSTGSIYQEVTDNQVEGVIEPDTFKRTDRHLFYLDRGSLLAYSIAGESSELVGEYSRATDAEEFFLSADGQRLTLISSASSFVHVTLLDVSDPANMTELKAFRATGRYYSARMVGGKLLLLMGNNIIGEPNYSDVATFVPRYDTGDGLQTLPADRIHYPEKLNSSN
ncbi:MAG: beta-propeller domain-containing protein [Clostridia bacterium]|nr:beta-propeller domain-containing protein [Clostridia bacterium]